MNLRNQIADNIVKVIKEIDYPRPVLVTREPFNVAELAITQFPAVLVSVLEETRQTITMGLPGVGRRSGTIVFNLRAFVRGTELDQRRNELLEAIEEELDSDRYRDLYVEGVTDSQITLIEIQERQPPLGEILIRFEVVYNYLRGTT
jgi:hypothetical protein